ncbi:hypothetical protein FNF29_04226 [Cafeteria roenbergensis]|uniref:Uncharacterized protein n=1 Tax=Cafeteria roenbergensis TaxID=33653 RepID=A0A5A8CI68_CAFRO|nr:hypothetical protein FNF29_04226 [Cafeteria roenbergensis]|eukprot:KAA0151820.1 hypothetical protein FNF29_04226 [Cafeteria roenbergensis]
MAARVDGDIVAVAPLPLIRAVGILSRHVRSAAPLFLTRQSCCCAVPSVADKDLSIEACGGVARSPFTGLLQLVDDEKTFGWVTGTGIKIFLTSTTRSEALGAAFAAKVDAVTAAAADSLPAV